MSKGLIERLRLMSADTYGNDAADALESLEAAYSGAVEAGKALAKQALKAERERDALAAELKALREQELVAWGDEPWMASFGVRVGRDSSNSIDLIFTTVGQRKFQLYAHEAAYLRGLLNKAEIPGYPNTHPVPARELTDETIQRHWDEACKDTPQTPGWSRHIRFARAIKRYLKGEGE